MRQLYDSVEAHIRALEALGRTSDHYEELFLPLILNKILKDVRLIIYGKVPRDSWNLKEFKEELNDRERCEYTNVSISSGRDERKPEFPAKSSILEPSTASALLVETHTPLCVYCRQPHASNQCSVVSVQKRKEILRSCGRCYICIRRNYISRNCKSKSRCTKCQGKHHVSICESGETKECRDDPVPAAQSGHRSNTEETKNTADEKVAGTSSFVCVGTKAAILLQTARVTLYRPDRPHRRISVRVILDGGSQGSYVTERLKNDLNLQSSHTKSLTINGCGSSIGTDEQCEVVNICIVSSDKDVQVFAISVPLISSPTRNQFPRMLQTTILTWLT